MKTATAVNLSAAVILALLQLVGLAALLTKSQAQDTRSHGRATQAVLTVTSEEIHE